MNKKVQKNIVCIDFETGGLDCRTAAATEVGATVINLDGFKEVASYRAYIKPYGRPDFTITGLKPIRKRKGEEGQTNAMLYGQEALDYSNIKMETLRSKGVELKEVVSNLVDLFKKANLGGHTKRPIILGQNVNFDVGFLQQIFSFCKEDLSKLVSGEKDFYGNFKPDTIDSMHWSFIHWGADDTVVKHKLGMICDRLEIELVNAHSALDDVRATAEVINVFRKRWNNSSESNDRGDFQERTRDHFKF